MKAAARCRAVRGLRDPIVTYGLTGRDRALLGSGLARLALLMLEAGADEVYPSFRGAPLIRKRSDLATMHSAYSASKASVMTVHLCSTVPMGEDLAKCGANSFGRVHGTEQRVGQRRLVAADCSGREPAGHSHGVGHSQRPTICSIGAPAWLIDSQPPQTTVITGASGWLGRALVDRMLSDPSRPQLRLLAHTTAEARALHDLATSGTRPSTS